MRYAFARAGQHFFGWFIAVLVYVFLFSGKDVVEKHPAWQPFLLAFIIASLAGAYTFFSQWSKEQEKEQHARLHPEPEQADTEK